MSLEINPIVHADARNFPVYDTNDLNFFQKILNDIVDEFDSIGSLSINDKQFLRSRLASAIFKAAEAGDRDYFRLKRRAIDAVSAVPPSVAEL